MVGLDPKRWLPVVALLAAGCSGRGAGIAWVSSHEGGLAQARAQGRPVMIEFTADWCVPCRELDERTYPDAAVRAQAARFVNIRIDATDPDAETEALLQRYKVYGLPTLVFLDSAGRVLSAPRPSGFVEPRELAALLAAVP